MKPIHAVTLVTALAIPGLACEAGGMEEVPGAAESAAEQRADTATEAATGAERSVTLAVDSLEGAGAYLTDGQGRALYLLEGEPADSSTCYDACAQEWPPLLAASQTPRAGTTPVRQDLVGTIQRRDGQRQVTYAGHALYYYHDDQQAGQTSGHDLTDQWGEWYLVTPAGEHLEEGGS